MALSIDTGSFAPKRVHGDEPFAVQESLPVYRSSSTPPTYSSADVPTAQTATFVLPAHDVPPSGPFSSLTVIGQFHSSYLVCQDRDELVLIDQHAAHERISFERLRQQFLAQGVSRQELMFPVVMEFDFKEAAHLAQNLEQFTRFGFDIEPFGGNAFVLKAIPQLMTGAETEQLVRDVAAELGALGESNRIEDAFEHVLMTMACHGSVRANQTLSTPQMVALLNDLDQVDFNGHCPHGRPVIQRMTLGEIGRMFKRT
jgi:DNA mismatch repair protein MutL